MNCPNRLYYTDDYNLRCALNAYSLDNYLNLDHPASQAGLIDRRTPESIYFKKAAMIALSEDAQWVISVITQSSDAVWYRFTSDTGRFLKEKLNRWLHIEHKWTWNRIWRVMSEIRTFANGLE